MPSLHDYLNAKHELAVRVTPNAPKNMLGDWVEDEHGARWLQVKITAVPEDGKANDALIRFLAKHFSVAPSSLEIIAGHTHRLKRIAYHG